MATVRMEERMVELRFGWIAFDGAAVGRTDYFRAGLNSREDAA